jgi:predicted dehydrogenase
MNRTTRRATLTSLTGGMLIVKPKVAFSYAANSAVSFGIIGTGGRGRYVGKIFSSDPRVRLDAICDIRPERLDLAKTELPGADKARSYKDLQEMLALRDLDAVLIATPVYLHPEHFEAAVQAKKHIYQEKPAGASVAGVKRLLAAAGRADKSKSIAFGFQQRFSPEYLAAENILRSGQLGDLTLMISYWIWGGNAFQGEPIPKPTEELDRIKTWTSWKDTSGDFIVEQDCHGLDVLNWFAQAHPEKAIGSGSSFKRKRGDNSDNACVIYEYPGGLKGWLMGTQLPPRPYWDVKEQFIGTLGVLETERKYYQWFQAAENHTTKVSSKREITIDAVEAFLDSIVDGKPLNMVKSSADSTLTSLLGRMAIEQKREVTWEELLRSA